MKGVKLPAEVWRCFEQPTLAAVGINDAEGGNRVTDASAVVQLLATFTRTPCMGVAAILGNAENDQERTCRCRPGP